MSRAKHPPIPRDEMLDREEIKELTGCTQAQIIYITKYRPNCFPKPVHRGANRRLFYNKIEMLDWISKNDIKQIFKDKEATYYSINKGKVYLGLDTKAAIQFITSKPVGYAPSTAPKAKRYGKRNVIRLEEHHGAAVVITPNAYLNRGSEWFGLPLDNS